MYAAQKRRHLADAPLRLPAVLLKYRHNLAKIVRNCSSSRKEKNQTSYIAQGESFPPQTVRRAIYINYRLLA
jgi:hypothetical protein